VPLHPYLRHAVPLTFALAFGVACGRDPSTDTTASQEEQAPPSDAKAKSGKLFEDIAAPLEFRDPDPGPRAPVTTAFGAEIGRSSYEQIQALVKARGYTCKDTSIRAMMETKREAEREKQKAEGADAVSSASWLNKKSKREKNPQVRFSCPSVTYDEIGDRDRPASRGRLLYVFDSEELPLRHISYQRSHANHTAALNDYEDAVKTMTAIYGEPTATRGEAPERDANGKATFPESRSLELRWDFSDLSVRVTAIHFGRKVTVGERLEVPHGIRPDAPSLGKPAGVAPSPVATPKPPPSTPEPEPKPTTKPELTAAQKAAQEAQEAKELEGKMAADAASQAKAAAKR